MNITTYAAAAEYLAAGRNGTDRPLPGNATRLIRRGSDHIAVCYRGTDVVTFWADGTYSLNRGGWNSKTTADRIETYSPFRIGAGRFVGTWSGKILRHGPETWEVVYPCGFRRDIRDGYKCDPRPNPYAEVA